MTRKTTEERRTIERFRHRYGRQATTAARAVERAGIGANVDSNGYTTVEQAKRLGRLLRLRPGDRLLDVGCGRGYPGLYLAQESGCSVVGADLPMASLLTARERCSESRRLARRVSLVAASAVHLPFRPGSFDAIVHTDVLC